MGHEQHGGDHAGHHHGITADADRRWLSCALALLLAFMVAEVVVGLLAGSLALLSDAAHMTTDAAAIGLALITIRLMARPARGSYTYGLQRAEILSAHVNGVSLLALAVFFGFEGVRRLITPPEVEGALVFGTALVGIVVNLAATWCIRQANRSSLNVEGAYQHILNDLFAFIATAVAGAVVWLTGWTRADAVAALIVAGLMVKAGWSLVRASGRIFLEAAPEHLDPETIGHELVLVPGVLELHDLHVWQITSEQAAVSAHVLVEPSADCHSVRAGVAGILLERYAIEHSTLQVDHAARPTEDDTHCSDPHGRVFRRPSTAAG